MEAVEKKQSHSLAGRAFWWACAVMAVLLFALAMNPAAAHALSNVDNGYHKEVAGPATYDYGTVHISVFQGTRNNYTAAGQIKLTIWNNTKSSSDNYGYSEIHSRVAREYTITREITENGIPVRLGRATKADLGDDYKGLSSYVVTSKEVQPHYTNLCVMIPLAIKVPAHYCVGYNGSTTASGNDGGVCFSGGARLNFYSYDKDNDYDYSTLRSLEHEEKAHWETVWVQVNLLRTGIVSMRCDEAGRGDLTSEGTPTKVGTYYRHLRASAWINLGLASESVRLVLGTKEDYDAGKVYSTWSKWGNVKTVTIGGVKYVYSEIAARKCLAAKTTKLPTDATKFHRKDVVNEDGSITKYSFDGWKVLSRSAKVSNNKATATVLTSHGSRTGDEWTHCNQYGTTLSMVATTIEGMRTQRIKVTKNEAAVYFIAKWADTTTENNKYTVHYWFSPTKKLDIDYYTNVYEDGEYERGYRYSTKPIAAAIARQMISIENQWLKYAATTYTCPDCGQEYTCDDASYHKDARDNDTRNDHWKAYLVHLDALAPVDTSYTRYSCSQCSVDDTVTHTHNVVVDWGSYLSCSSTEEDHTHTSSCYSSYPIYGDVNFCTAYTMYRYKCPDCEYSFESTDQATAYNAVASHIAAISRDMDTVGTLGEYAELDWDGTWWIGQKDQPMFAEEWVDGTPLTVESTGYKNDLYLYANCDPLLHNEYTVTLIVNPGTDGEATWTESARANVQYEPSDEVVAEIEDYYGILSEDYGRLVGWWYDKGCSELEFYPIGIGKDITIYAYTEHYIYYGLTERAWSLEKSSRELFEDSGFTTPRKALLEYNLGTNATAALDGKYRRSELVRYGEIVEFDVKTTELWGTLPSSAKKRSTSNSEGYYATPAPTSTTELLSQWRVTGTKKVYRDWAGGIYDGVYSRSRL